MARGDVARCDDVARDGEVVCGGDVARGGFPDGGGGDGDDGGTWPALEQGQDGTLIVEPHRVVPQSIAYALTATQVTNMSRIGL